MDEVLRALRMACQELEARLRGELLGLALFGSWARGEAEEGSDVDVFIVSRKPLNRELRFKVYDVLYGLLRRDVTIVDIPASELTKEDLEVTPLLLNIGVDAIAIYDPESILEKIIRGIKELIMRAGLKRYRTIDGKYGWMRYDGRPLAITEVNLK